MDAKTYSHEQGQKWAIAIAAVVCIAGILANGRLIFTNLMLAGLVGVAVYAAVYSFVLRSLFWAMARQSPTIPHEGEQGGSPRAETDVPVEHVRQFIDAATRGHFDGGASLAQIHEHTDASRFANRGGTSPARALQLYMQQIGVLRDDNSLVG